MAVTSSGIWLIRIFIKISQLVAVVLTPNIRLRKDRHVHLDNRIPQSLQKPHTKAKLHCSLSWTVSISNKVVIQVIVICGCQYCLWHEVKIFETPVTS